MPWCRFFIPKIASPNISPDDPELNEHIMYAKCVKGHVLKDASDWILCENLPAPDAKCWQEGGDTLFTLAARRRQAAPKSASDSPAKEQAEQSKASSGTGKSKR